MSYIKFQNVFKNDKERADASLEKLNISIEKDDFLLLSGDNSFRKKTFLNLIAGFEKADSGKIIIDNTIIDNLNHKKIKEFRKENIFLFFESENLIKDYTIFENIDYFLTLKNKSTKDKNYDEINKALKKLLLMKEKNIKVKYLSSFDRQKAIIAKAFALKPKIILAEKPLSPLNNEEAEHLCKILSAFNKKEKVCIICASDNEVFSSYATRQIKIQKQSFKEIQNDNEDDYNRRKTFLID